MQVRTPAALTTALALAAALTPLSGQEARQLQPYGLYPAGTVLSSPLTGITFRLPEGFRAEWDRDLGGLLTLSTDGAFGAVWGWSEGTLEEVASEVGTRLEASGFELQPRTQLEVTAQSLRGIFDAGSDGVRGVLHASIQVGPQGGVLAAVGIGEPSVEETARLFVERLTSSLQWSAPGVVAWRQRVEGSVLARTGEGSVGSTGTSRTPGGPLGTVTLALCGANEYRYQETSGGPSGTSMDEHAGQWWLVADLAGTPTLFLEATDGGVFRWLVQESGAGWLIDGHRYRVTGPC